MTLVYSWASGHEDLHKLERPGVITETFINSSAYLCGQAAKKQEAGGGSDIQETITKSESQC